MKRDGCAGMVESLRPRPPHIKRRGAAVHPVYEALQKHALSASEATKQVYGALGPQPYTLYYKMQRGTGDMQLLTTVSWRDMSGRVDLVEIVSEPTLSEAARAALHPLVREPVGSGGPRPQAALPEFVASRGHPLIVRSWTSASLFGGEGVDVNGAWQHAAKMQSRLHRRGRGQRLHTRVLWETCTMLRLLMSCPDGRLQGRICTKAARAVVFSSCHQIFSQTNLAAYVDTVVRTRIGILRLHARDCPSLGMIALHRIHTPCTLNSLAVAHSVVIGDMKKLAAVERRLDMFSGVVRPRRDDMTGVLEDR